MKEQSVRPLNTLQQSESGTVSKITASSDVALKLVEMGVVEGEHVKLIRRAPFGDPIEIEVMSARLAIRKNEAKEILIK